LRDQEALSRFEAFITAQRADEPLPTGDLDYAHYCALHRHLFQDVFSWAGRVHTVRLAKAGHAFCYPENIDREMNRLFRELADRDHLRSLDRETFAGQAAHFLAELNATPVSRRQWPHAERLPGIVGRKCGTPAGFSGARPTPVARRNDPKLSR
jgi:fido (protein-threonine AMPylation protein)